MPAPGHLPASGMFVMCNLVWLWLTVHWPKLLLISFHFAMQPTPLGPHMDADTCPHLPSARSHLCTPSCGPSTALASPYPAVLLAVVQLCNLNKPVGYRPHS